MVAMRSGYAVEGMLRFRTVMQAAAAAILCSSRAHSQERIVNGGFEVLPTTGWQGLSDNFFTGDPTFNSFGAHSGRLWLSFGCAFLVCSTLQHVITEIGKNDTFSFWSASD